MQNIKLNSTEIELFIQKLDNWLIEPKYAYISKEWQFKDFKSVLRFIDEVGKLAESQNHHPEILTTYTKLRIRLWTHDASGITQKDFDLALAIDMLIASSFKEFIIC